MLPPALIFKHVNNKQEFGDDLLLWSDVYMNRKSSFISTDLFISVVHRTPPQIQTFREAYSTFRLHRTHCSSPLLFQTAVGNKVANIRLPNHCTHTLQPLDKLIFGPLKNYLKNEDAAW